MGEEWRKGWHPERVAARTVDDAFLVVGAGPAGLECARILGKRGRNGKLIHPSKAHAAKKNETRKKKRKMSLGFARHEKQRAREAGYRIWAVYDKLTFQILKT